MSASGDYEQIEVKEFVRFALGFRFFFIDENPYQKQKLQDL